MKKQKIVFNNFENLATYINRYFDKTLFYIMANKRFTHIHLKTDYKGSPLYKNIYYV